MDFQNRPGGKTGGGGVASWSESNRDRRERLRLLALETIDLNKDPYFMKNHLGKLFIWLIYLVKYVFLNLDLLLPTHNILFDYTGDS